MTDHDSLRELWASDQGEKFTMSITELTARSDRFRSRIHRRNLIEYVAAALVVSVFGWLAFIVPVWSVRVGAILIILAAIYISWQLNRVAPLSQGYGSADNLVSVYRRELVRQRDALKTVWRWYLLPFLPGIVIFVLGTKIEAGVSLPVWAIAISSAMSLGFVALIFLGIWLLNAYAARKLDIEIKALDSVSEN